MQFQEQQLLPQTHSKRMTMTIIPRNCGRLTYVLEIPDKPQTIQKSIHTTASYNVILAIQPASTPHILDIYNAAQLRRVNSCSNETGRGHECLVGRG
jgi:hypothetical protein